MHRMAAASSQSRWPLLIRGKANAQVEAVVLLGVRITAYAVINVAEHQRRDGAGLGAVTDPALLDRLLDLPVAVPVIDPVVWAEMAGQPRAIIERDEDASSVRRLMGSPLTIEDAVVHATAGRELGAVQDASLFAGYARRWVTVAKDRIPDAVLLEAKLCGVGILDPDRRVLLPAEKPVALTMDGWSWLLQEKVYRRWLRRRAQDRVMESQPQATDGASVVRAV
jgi:hypothetical protein